MAKIGKNPKPEKQFEPFALEFETLEEAVTALALLNTPITFRSANGTVREWVDGKVGGRKRITGTYGKRVEADNAATGLWQAVAAELQAQGFYHGLRGTE